MSSSFKKDALELEIIKRGLQFPEGVKTSNANLIKLLGNDYLKNNPQECTFGRMFTQNLQSVMLIDHLKDYKEKLPKDNEPLTSEDYISEIKLNDFRVLTVYSPETGFEFFSRNEAVGTYCTSNWTDKILLIDKGIVRTPESFKGVFKSRFVLDGGVTIGSRNTTFDGVQYGTREDLLQSVLGSLSVKARNWQLEGNTLQFVGFDVLYFEKEAVPVEQLIQEFKYPKEDVTEEEAMWVDKHFMPFLISSGFVNPNEVVKPKAKKVWEKSPGKGVYAYLASLKDSLKGDMRKLPFGKRRELRNTLIQFLKDNCLPFEHIPTEDEDKTSFADEALRTGEEGIILKSKHAPYFATENRSHRAMFKVKTNLIEAMKIKGFSGDLDAYVIGCTQPKSKDFKAKGLFGALNVAVYLKKEDGTVIEHQIASVSGLKHEDKLAISYIDEVTGEINIKKEHLNRVVAINGMCMSNKDLKFQHAVLYYEQDNTEKKLVFKAKNPTQCTQEEIELKKLILVRGE